MILRYFFAICLLSLSSCAPYRSGPSTNAPMIDNPQQHQQQLAQLTRWSLQGKIAIRQAKHSDSAALRWQQDEDHFDIFVSGPLGAGATRLSGTPQRLTIQNDDVENTTTDDPAHLMKKHLGWELPLQKLPQWITGRSDNLSARFNTDHTLADFSEQDWQVEYARYQTTGQWLLPEKIILHHENMHVTIFIKRWELP